MYVPMLDALFRRGLAYIVEVAGLGTFVCLDFDSMCVLHPDVALALRTLSPKPVRYPIVPVRSPYDYALWAPSCDGNLSQWGRGLKTVNCDYCLNVIQPLLNTSK